MAEDVKLSYVNELAIMRAYGHFWNCLSIHGHYKYAYPNFMELCRTLKICYGVDTLEQVCEFDLFLTEERIAFITSNRIKPEPKDFVRNPIVYEEIKEIMNPFDQIKGS